MPASAHAVAPKYFWVKEKILALIDGAAPGTVIPTERVLAERYATSRTTVRRAIGELVSEGWLDRTQGSGTFVAPPKLTHVRQLTSFSDDARQKGRESSSLVVGVERVPADPATAAGLGVRPDRPVHRVERVRMIDGEPLAHEVAFLPGRLRGLPRRLAQTGSLYAALREGYGIEIASVEDTVETSLAGPREVELLDVEMGAPMLVVQRQAWDASGKPVEFTRSVFRGDRFRFVARMGPPAPATPPRSRISAGPPTL